MDYKKPRHAESLIEAFYTYKQHELFCDATLVVDEEQIGSTEHELFLIIPESTISFVSCEIWML